MDGFWDTDGYNAGDNGYAGLTLATTTTFYISFNEDVNPSTVNANDITFTPSVPFNVSVDIADWQFEIDPTTDLLPDTHYIFSFNCSGVIDTNDNSGSDDTNDGNDNYYMVDFETFRVHTEDLLWFGGFYPTPSGEDYVFWFDTPDTATNYLDHSYLTKEYIRVFDSGDPAPFSIEVQDVDIETMGNDPGTFITIRCMADDIDDVFFSYMIRDTEGNTLDGNGNSVLEMDYRDDYWWN